jgi:dihydroorotate dehydrogenase (NAD+) catalytic subunit
MSVTFCGLELAHPIINGSGTFDAIAAARAFGEQVRRELPFAAYVSKTITLGAREGNPPPRLWEAPAGLINSIGLPNKGLEGYLGEDLPLLVGMSCDPPDGAGAFAVPVITNVMGSTAGEFARLVEACDARAESAALELNVSWSYAPCGR